MLQNVVKEILARKQQGKRMLIGVDGLSGAGKTTLADEVVQELTKLRLSVVVIHIDDLIVERNKRYGTGLEEWQEHYFVQWDVEHIKQTLFHPWANGAEELVLDVYDKPNDSISSKRVSVPADSILLIEGVFLQRKEWRVFYDFVMYVDCPRVNRFERVTSRENMESLDEARLERYRKRYWAAEDHYLQAEKPVEKADFILGT